MSSSTNTNSNDPLFFKVGPMMSKAGIVEFSQMRLDFIFKIATPTDKEVTYSAFADFLPTDSFNKNRESILKRLAELFKEKTLLINTKEEFNELKQEITTILSDNSAVLMDRMSSNIFETKGKKVEEVYAYKYSSNFTSILYETVILEGIPKFIGYNAEAKTIEEKLYIIDEIDEVQRIVKPMPKEAHACDPYEFVNAQELFLYLKKAHFESISSLYTKSKNIVQKFVIQNQHIQRLIAVDTVWTYFQDKFGTCHFLSATGDNNSGKTAAGDTFEGIGYRVVNMTDPTAANIYRTLGSIEPGQVTIVLDEAEKINDFQDMLSCLKAGYQRKKRLPRTDSVDIGFKTNYYYPYCYKFIISEKGLSNFKAKGVLDRTLTFSTKPGDPAYDVDIKEVLAMGNDTDDPYLQKCYKEIIEFRNTMLLYRLIHFQDKFVNIDVGVTRRNKELAKPILQLFFETEVQPEIEQALLHFLQYKNERRKNTLEANLVPIILSWFGQNPEKGKVIVKPIIDIWIVIIKELTDKVYLPNTAPSFIEVPDFGLTHPLYKGTITSILRDKFSAEDKKSGTVRSLILNYDIVSEVAANYNVEIKIECKRKVYNEQENWDNGTAKTGSNEEVGISENFEGVKEE